MRTLAKIREGDVKAGKRIYFCAEETAAVPWPTMWLGYMVQEGEDDRVFAFEHTLEDIYKQIEHRWGNFATFRTVKEKEHGEAAS